MLPSLQLLEKVGEKIMSVPNRRRESKRGVHYGLFLLGYQAGLRVNEAVSFDLGNKGRQDLYRINKPKGKKERFVYIPKKVVRELKKNNWQPNQTNRWNFYHFLRKIKRELNISPNIELSPHNLRRAFTTYHAETGTPLPLLQKLLGHSSIRTTALYWRNIYQEPDNDIGDILAVKKWLERPQPSQNSKPSKSPSTENFPELLKTPETIFTANKPKLTKRPIVKATLPSFTEQKLLIQPKPHEQEILTKITDHQSINPLRKQPTEKQNLVGDQKEAILLAKIKQLEEQLRKTQKANKELTVKLAESEKGKIQERERANHYQQQLNSITQTLYQWQKIKHHQQLEQEQKEIQAQIIQPLPLKIK